MQRIADRVLELREQAAGLGMRPPGTAEFLDAVRAYESLGIRDLEGPTWSVIERLTLRKYDDGGPADDATPVTGRVDGPRPERL